MSHRIPNESSKHGRDAVRAVVRFESEGLLGRSVPHGHHQYETRVDCSFYGAEEETVRCDSCEVRACRRSNQDYSPYDGGDGEELADFQALEEVAGRELEEEIAKVENRALEVEKVRKVGILLERAFTHVHLLNHE